MATVEELPLEPNSPQQKYVVGQIEDYLKEQLRIIQPHARRIATEIWAITRETIRPVKRRA